MDEASIGKLWVEARETVRAAAADLGEVAGQFPVQSEQMEAKARILDRLSEELTEAAGMLRRSASRAPARLGISPAATSIRHLAGRPARRRCRAVIRMAAERVE